MSRVRGVTAREDRVLVALGQDDPNPCRVHGCGEAEMLLVCHHDLVIRAEAEAGEHGRAAARGRIGERDVQRIDVEHGCETRSRLFTKGEDPLDPFLPAPPMLEIAPRLVDHRVGRCTRDRPVRARVEIRVALEHGELRAGFLEGHPT